MINEAILVGHVGKKDKKTIANGSELVVLSLATTNKYKDANGEKQTRTTWHHINCFSKLGEIADKYVHVGDIIYIRGEILNKKVEQGERAGQYIYSVTAQDIRFLPGGKKKDSQPENNGNNEPYNNTRPPARQQSSQVSYDDLDDNIPF